MNAPANSETLAAATVNDPRWQAVVSRDPAADGTFFYFVVFPVAVEYLITFDPNLVPSLRIDDFLQFATNMFFIFGLTFELPLVALLLTRIGLLTPRMMVKFRRYAIVILAIAAAIITPTPDVINMMLLFVPLWALYEISIVICWWVRPLPKKEDGQQ